MGSLLKCLPGSQLQRPALELLPASLRPQRQRVWLGLGLGLGLGSPPASARSANGCGASYP